MAETSQVYGVPGLRHSLEELLCAQPLPIVVQAVWLPFKWRRCKAGRPSKALPSPCPAPARHCPKQRFTYPTTWTNCGAENSGYAEP